MSRTRSLSCKNFSICLEIGVDWQKKKSNKLNVSIISLDSESRSRALESKSLIASTLFHCGWGADSRRICRTRSFKRQAK
eukprot:4934582-Karenia_brevis.AAC.1